MLKEFKNLLPLVLVLGVMLVFSFVGTF